MSAALARILEQLNPTAWLPAAVVVGDVALALAYGSVAGDPGTRWRAVGALLDRKPLGVILGTLGALALVTILTQTFGYSAIRAREGYWGSSKVSARIVNRGIRRQEERHATLLKVRAELEGEALAKAMPLIKRALAGKPMVATAIEYRVTGIHVSAIDKTALAAADSDLAARSWAPLVPATLAHQISEVDRQLELFPRADRMMPSKLGLRLRVAEDGLRLPAQDGNLRGFVTRHLNTIEPRLLADHDEHRNRLDMLAVLTFAAILLIPINLFLLWKEASLPTLAVISAAAGVLSWSAYRGAVAAAGEYGQSLLAIDDALSGSRVR